MERAVLFLLFLSGTRAMLDPQTSPPQSQNNLLELLKLAQPRNLQISNSAPTSPPPNGMPIIQDPSGGQTSSIPSTQSGTSSPQLVQYQDPASQGPTYGSSSQTQPPPTYSPDPQQPTPGNAAITDPSQMIPTHLLPPSMQQQPQQQISQTMQQPPTQPMQQQTSQITQQQPPQTMQAPTPQTVQQPVQPKLPSMPGLMPGMFPPSMPRMSNTIGAPMKPFQTMPNMQFPQQMKPAMTNFQNPSPNNWMNMGNTAPRTQYNPFTNSQFRFPPVNQPQWNTVSYPKMQQPMTSPWGTTRNMGFMDPFQGMPRMNQGGSMPWMNQRAPMPWMNQRGSMPGMNQDGSMPWMNQGGSMPSINQGGMNRMNFGGTQGMSQTGLSSRDRTSSRGSSSGQQGLPDGAAKPYQNSASSMMNTLMLVQAMTGEPLELPMGARGQGMRGLGVPGLGGLNIPGLTGGALGGGASGLGALTGLGSGASGLGSLGTLLQGEGLGAALAMMQLAPELGGALTGMSSSTSSTGFGGSSTGFGGSSTGFGSSSTGFGGSSTGFGSSSTGFGSSSPSSGRFGSSTGFGSGTRRKNQGTGKSLMQMMTDPASRTLLNALGFDLPDLPQPAAGQTGAGGASQTASTNLWTSQATFDPIAAPTGGGGGSSSLGIFGLGSTGGSGTGSLGGFGCTHTYQTPTGNIHMVF